jgi:hypothetical protein
LEWHVCLCGLPWRRGELVAENFGSVGLLVGAPARRLSLGMNLAYP